MALAMGVAAGISLHHPERNRGGKGRNNGESESTDGRIGVDFLRWPSWMDDFAIDVLCQCTH